MGADRIIRLLVNLYRREAHGRAEFTMLRINGCPALIVWFDGRVDMALVFETESARISRIWTVRAANKLTALAAPLFIDWRCQPG